MSNLIPAPGYYLWMGHVRADGTPEPSDIMLVGGASAGGQIFSKGRDMSPYEEETVGKRAMLEFWHANKWKPLETAEAMTMIATWKLTS